MIGASQQTFARPPSVSRRGVADTDDAAGLDDVEAERPGAGNERVGFAAGIQPHFGDSLPRELVDIRSPISGGTYIVAMSIGPGMASTDG